jgi:photosystem II stability/assembly factor-like uncharacterized protein
MPENNQRGAVYALAATPDFVYQQQGICAAASATGLYLSDHNVSVWQKIKDEQTTQPITACAFAFDVESSASSVFAGAYGGVLRSADGGVNWQFAALATPPPVISSMVVSPDFSRDGTILVGTLEDGIFRSEDRGRLWSSANFGLLDLSVMSLAISPQFVSDETIFAGTESGVFRSTNGGRAWREIPFPMEHAPVLCLTFAQEDILLAGTESHGVFASHDNGLTWARLDAGMLTGAVNHLIPSASDAQHLIALHDDSLIVSHDSGQNWKASNANLGNGITAVAAPEGIHSNAHLLVGFNDGRIVTI